MKRQLLMILFLTIGWRVEAQVAYDSLPLYILSEVTIQDSPEVDTLQNFFRANRSATTEDIFSKMQGAYLVRRGGYGQEPMLRGTTAGQINVTIDGMKMFGACTDKMDPITIYVEPQNLKSMSVNLGSQGSRLGSTIGGSLDMQLMQPRFSSQAFSGQAGIGLQSVSQGFNTYALGNFSKSNSAYNFSINYRNANNYTAGDGKEVPYTQYEKVNVSLGAKWRVGGDTLQFNALADDGWNIGFPALPMDVGYAKARIYALTYNRVRCHGLLESFKTKIYYNSVNHSMDDSHRPDVAMHMDMPGESETAGAFIEGSLHPIQKHRLTFRTDYFNNHVMADMTMYPEGEPSMYMQTWPASSRSVAGFYLNDLYKINQATTIAANGRIDLNRDYLKNGLGKEQLEVFYPNISSTTTRVVFSSNVTLHRQLSEQMVLDVHTGFGERLPTLSETYGFYLFNRSDGYDYVGNPDLKNEKSLSGDITLSYFGSSFQISVNGFYQHIDHYIMGEFDPQLSPMTPGAHGVKVYANLPSAVLAGTELNLLANLSTGLTWMSITKYLQGRDNESNPLPQIPPLTTFNTLRFSHNAFATQLEFEGALQQNRINSGYGEDATPGYGIMNLRASYTSTFNRSTARFSAGVENLFDKNYHTHLDWGNIPRPGRNFVLSVEFDF